MQKRDIEKVPRIEIKELRKQGFLSEKDSGFYFWRSPFTGEITMFTISSVFIDTIDNPLCDDTESAHHAFEGTIEFKSVAIVYYDELLCRWLETGEPDVWQTASISTTPCNYGKSRFWFHCPGLKGARCGERVGILYWLDGRLACRKCHGLIYKMRNIAKSERGQGRIIPFEEMDRMWDELKRRSYKGKPTKRYLRVQKKQRELSTAIDRAEVLAENGGKLPPLK